VRYLRFESAVPNRRGTYPGLFALANGLARDGKLSAEDHAFWRAGNDFGNQAYPDPGVTHPELFDRAIRPFVACWFLVGAGSNHLVELARGFLDLLDRYDVPWVERRTDAPGPILYRDHVQVVAASWRKAGRS
jgi:hypothetical protein